MHGGKPTSDPSLLFSADLSEPIVNTGNLLLLGRLSTT